MAGRILYWLNNHIRHREGYQCFCLTCKYYGKCREEDYVVKNEN